MKKCGQILLHPHIGLLCVILCSVILSNAKDLRDSTAIECQHSPRDSSLRSE